MRAKPWSVSLNCLTFYSDQLVTLPDGSGHVSCGNKQTFKNKWVKSGRKDAQLYESEDGVAFALGHVVALGPDLRVDVQAYEDTFRACIYHDDAQNG